MRKFRICHNYDIDIPLFEDICFNPYPEDEDNLKKLEHLKSREEFERVEDERCLQCRARVCAVANLPAAVRALINPDMLGWIEESVYYKKEHYWTWNVVPYYFKEHIKCFGTMSLHAREGGGMLRVTEGIVDLRFPVLGEMMEIFVVDSLKKSLDHEHALFGESIERRKKRKNNS